MITLLWLTPLLYAAPVTETLTLTSGLTIEAKYLPTEDAFLVGLEDFGALTADLELAGPSCTVRVNALKATCASQLSDALQRAGERCATIEEAWLIEQEERLKLETQLADTRASLSIWSWLAGGASAVALGALTYIAVTR
jgi:hypothetical protein